MTNIKNFVDVEDRFDALNTKVMKFSPQPKPVKKVKTRKQPLTKAEIKEKLKAKRLRLKEKKHSSPSQVIKRCDTLFSQIIRARDGKCLRCGKTNNLQCAHIFSRKNYSTRWDLDNAITLCYGCHIFWAHKNPVDFTYFVEDIIGGVKMMLIKIASHMTVKRTTEEYLDLEKYLHEKLKSLTNMDD